MKNPKEVEFINDMNFKYDYFIVWSKHLDTLILTPLDLFCNYLDAKECADKYHKNSKEHRMYFVVGYNTRKLFDSGFEVFDYI